MVFMTCCGGVCSAKVLTMVQNSNRRHLSMSKKERKKRWRKLFILFVENMRFIPAVGKLLCNIRTPAPQVACGCLQSEREKLIRLSHCAIRTWAQQQKAEFDSNLNKSPPKGQNEHTKRASNIPAHVEERSGRTQLSLQCRLLPTAERSKKKQTKKKLFRFKFSTFSLILETFLELICYRKDIVTLILVYVEAAFSGSLLKSRGANSVCTTPGEMLCKQTFQKWVGVKWNTALYVTHVSGNYFSVTQHWAVPLRCCCINVCSATTFWRFGNRTIPNIQKTQSGSHCGSDVSVGLAQLLPQALRQRRHGKLGAAVEMGVCAVDDAVSTHTASVIVKDLSGRQTVHKNRNLRQQDIFFVYLPDRQ